MSDELEHMSESWPELLRFFAELTSAYAALKLATNYGGTTIYVPRADNLKKDHPLAISLDFENAKALCGEYGGEYVEVPMGPARTSKLSELIRAFAKDGHSNGKIARMAGTTERNVRRVLNAEPKPNHSNQRSLF